MDGWRACLLYKHENWTLDPQNPHWKSQVVVVATSITSEGVGGGVGKDS